MQKKTKLLFFIMFLLIAATVGSNYMEEAEVDSNKLPLKVETSKGFQRWITNHKKRMDISADDFTLKDKNEVYNAAFLEVSRLETDEEINAHLALIESFRDLDDVAFSPNDRQLIDHRHEDREGYEPNEAHYYGLRETNVIDTKILTCISTANCYFDRAYFLDNHTFVISEISRNFSKEEIKTAPPCTEDELCTYTFKLHFIDLINNARFVYESTPFERILSEMVQFF